MRSRVNNYSLHTAHYLACYLIGLYDILYARVMRVSSVMTANHRTVFIDEKRLMSHAKYNPALLFNITHYNILV